jgi:hypothetical protein
MAAIRRQGGRNLQDLEVVVLEASGALTVGQHDHIQELLERLQRIEAAVTPTVRAPGPHPEPLQQPTSLPGRGSGPLRLAGITRRQPARCTDGRWPCRRPSAPTSSSPARATCTTQPERSPDAQLRSRFLFGRGQTRALVNSAPPHAPIDDRDRVESGSPLPRRLTVAIP